jgi:hypothetical protein
MATLPHDVTDLYFAPVVLALDEQIDDLGRLDLDQLTLEVALESDTADGSRQLREQALLRTISHLVDCHNWRLSWDTRGLRVTNGPHTVVLGLPPVLTEYLSAASPRERVASA